MSVFQCVCCENRDSASCSNDDDDDDDDDEFVEEGEFRCRNKNPNE